MSTRRSARPRPDPARRPARTTGPRSRRVFAVVAAVLAVAGVVVLVPVLRGSAGTTAALIPVSTVAGDPTAPGSDPSDPSGPGSGSGPADPAAPGSGPAGTARAAVPRLGTLATTAARRTRPTPRPTPAPAPTTAPTAAPTAPPPAGTTAGRGASIWKSAGMATALRDSGVSWFYSWGPDDKGVRAPGVEFVPMIWGAGSADAATIATAKASGSTLLGFNEPDLAGQAEMSVERALELWPRLQATGMRLGAPAVAYGGATAGGWLDRFMAGAAARGYRVDFIPLHWYGGDFRAGPATDQLKAYVTAVWNRYHKPVWLTEYALLKFGPTTYPSAAVQADFVTRSTAMLAGLSFVERYAWFSLATPDEGGDGTGLYRPDGTRTAAGTAYRAAR